MTSKEEKEVSTTAKCTLSENGIFDKAHEDEPAEDDIESDDSEPDWEEGVENDGSWIGRGPNKNPTRGVVGIQSSPKGTKSGPKGTQVGTKGTKASPKGTRADPKTVKK